MRVIDPFIGARRTISASGFPSDHIQISCASDVFLSFKRAAQRNETHREKVECNAKMYSREEEKNRTEPKVISASDIKDSGEAPSDIGCNYFVWTRAI